MTVKLLLHGNLKKYYNDLPEIELDLPQVSTVEELIHAVKVPSSEIAFAAVGGSRVSMSYELNEGDEVKLFQFVGGG